MTLNFSRVPKKNEVDEGGGEKEWSMIKVTISGQNGNSVEEYSTRKEAFAKAKANANSLSFVSNPFGDYFHQRMEKKTVRVNPITTRELLFLVVRVPRHKWAGVMKKIVVDILGVNPQEVDLAREEWGKWHSVCHQPSILEGVSRGARLAVSENLREVVLRVIGDPSVQYDDGGRGIGHTPFMNQTSPVHDLVAAILEAAIR